MSYPLPWNVEWGGPVPHRRYALRAGGLFVTGVFVGAAGVTITAGLVLKRAWEGS